MRSALLDQVGGVGLLGVQRVHGDHTVGQVGVVNLFQQRDDMIHKSRARPTSNPRKTQTGRFRRTPGPWSDLPSPVIPNMLPLAVV